MFLGPFSCPHLPSDYMHRFKHGLRCITRHELMIFGALWRLGTVCSLPLDRSHLGRHETVLKPLRHGSKKKKVEGDSNGSLSRKKIRNGSCGNSNDDETADGVEL